MNKTKLTISVFVVLSVAIIVGGIIVAHTGYAIRMPGKGDSCGGCGKACSWSSNELNCRCNTDTKKCVGVSYKEKQSKDACTDHASCGTGKQCAYDKYPSYCYCYSDAGCPSGQVCKNRVCVKPVPCKDSDGGEVLDKAGACTMGAAFGFFNDICIDSSKLRENKCEDNKCVAQEINCPSGTICKNDACVQQQQSICVDECSKPKCYGTNSFRECGNFDSDPCLDWKNTITNCPQGQYCTGDGICVPYGA